MAKMGAYQSSFDINKANKVLEKYFGNEEQETVLNVVMDQDNYMSIGDLYNYHENKKMVLRKFQNQFLRELIDQIGNHKSKKAVLKGISGCGLTTSLIIIRQIAKEMGILVVDMNARKLTSETYSLDWKLCEYLTMWCKENEELLDKFEDKEIIKSIKKMKNSQDNAVIFENIFDYLREQHVVPVLFLVDDYNAFFSSHYIRRYYKDSTSINPIRKLFTEDIMNFPIKYGGALFTISSEYDVKPTSGIMNVNPFTKNEWRLLIENTKETRIIDNFSISRLSELLGCLPSELRRLEKVIQSDPSLSGKMLELTYMHEASDIYLNKLKGIYRENTDLEFAKAAMRIYLHIPNQSYDVLKSWLNSGLVVLDKRPLLSHFVCEPVRLAYRILSKREPKILNLNATGLSSSDYWLRLETLFVFKCELAIENAFDNRPARLIFTASSILGTEKMISIEFDHIRLGVTLDDFKSDRDSSEMPIIRVEPGTALIFAERFSGVDCVVVDKQSRLYFFKFSLIKSVQLETSPEELFETNKNLPGDCLYYALKRAITDIDGDLCDSDNDCFIHVQPSSNKIKDSPTNTTDFEKINPETDKINKIACFKICGGHAKEFFGEYSIY